VIAIAVPILALFFEDLDEWFARSRDEELPL
jgi:hypothetical protein